MINTLTSKSANRRSILVGGAAAMAGTVAAPAQSQGAWPNRPIRFLVGFAAGGATDAVARIVAPGFQAALGQQVVVENRAGASGNLASEAVARATDGHTFLVAQLGQLVINPHTFQRMPIDPLRDLEPVALMVGDYLQLVTHSSVPARDHGELVALMRARPGSFSYASAGAGGIMHVIGETWMRAVGVQAEAVHYRGGAAALPDVLAGRVPLFIEGLQLLNDPLSAGRLTGMFTTSPERHVQQPQIPTTREIGLPQVNFFAWFALCAPRGTPREVIERMATVNRAVILDAPNRERFASLAKDTLPSTPEEARERILEEHRIFGEVVRAANIRAE